MNCKLISAVYLVLTLGVITYSKAYQYAEIGQTFVKSEQVAPPFSEEEWLPAGAMTHTRLSDRSFVHAGKATSKKQQLDFWTGFSLFKDPWVIAPSSTKDRDGLGPLFNARSCIACHGGGSRGKMAQTGESLPISLVLRVGSSTIADYQNDHAYGGQIQPRAIRFNQGSLQKKPQGEAWLLLTEQIVHDEYSDGEKFELIQPSYQLTKKAYGELPEHVTISPRLSPNIFGAGLLDAISESDLLNQEDIDDKNADGISAKYNRVPDVLTGKTEIGRFGLKAKQPSLAQQVSAAFRDDIGITNSFFKEETCTAQQLECIASAKLGGHSSVEIPDKLLDLVISFNRLLGVPPARNLTHKTVQLGRELFYRIGCHSCHTPSYFIDESSRIDENYRIDESNQIADQEKSAITGQKIWPYTDLALHDMGENLSDNVLEFSATGQEWRTPPLWGIGLQKKILGEQRLLHDGRARNVVEAVLWHGGEASLSQQQFIKLSKQERRALVLFVNSI